MVYTGNQITSGQQGVMGDKKYVVGTWTATTGVSTELLDTGLIVCEHIVMTYTNTTGNPTLTPMVESTLPEKGDNIYIRFESDFPGSYLAYGY